MNAPISAFARAYAQSGGLRMHMPGHKGMTGALSALDITEISGADELYADEGIIRESQQNTAALFGSRLTLYSTEGSSLCIRAMVYLALLEARRRGRAPVLLAARNCHKAFLSALAHSGMDVQWLWSDEADGIVSCNVSPDALRHALSACKTKPAGVYVTSPDYLGRLQDIAGLSRVCREADVPLLVDNAHGAYLKFLEKDLHPLSLGADLCCDSAHKTLPVLTGGAYLHIAKTAPEGFTQNARRAMALYASSSPSYLTLISLDECNDLLENSFPAQLKGLCARLNEVKRRLTAQGYVLTGDEPLKLSLRAKSYGYSGDALHAFLRARGIEAEFSDPDYLTAMPSPVQGEAALECLTEALMRVPKAPAIPSCPPPAPRPARVLSVREAFLRPAQEVPVSEALGRVFVWGHVSCPPCVPILAPGERVDEAALECFAYYNVQRIQALQNLT